MEYLYTTKTGYNSSLAVQIPVKEVGKHEYAKKEIESIVATRIHVNRVTRKNEILSNFV